MFYAIPCPPPYRLDLLTEKLGVGSDVISGAMDSLLGIGNKMDLGSLVSGLQSNGLGDLASSWLGDGENENISADQLKDVLGGDEVSAAAAQLGLMNGLC